MEDEESLKSFSISSKQFEHVFGFRKTDNVRFWIELARMIGVEEPDEQTKTVLQNEVNGWLKIFSDNREEMPRLRKKWNDYWPALKEEVVLKEAQRNLRTNNKLRLDMKDSGTGKNGGDKRNTKKNSKDGKDGDIESNDKDNSISNMSHDGLKGQSLENMSSKGNDGRDTGDEDQGDFTTWAQKPNQLEKT
jgi:hypothetical protein